MLDYLPEVVINQPKAGIWVNGASDFVYTDYYGHMQITPETHVWLDEQQMPQVNIDFDDQFTQLIAAVNAATANSINWGSWSAWSQGAPGDIVEWPARGLNVGSFNTTRSRTGTRTTVVPGAVTSENINTISDLSLQGFMRTTDENGDPFTISIDITGLMPNVDHACTIGGIPVDLTYDSAPVNAAGSIGTHTYQTKTTVTTSNDGALTATIQMPSGVLSGNAPIKVFYYDNPDISVAYCNFYSAGIVKQEQGMVIGIPSVSTSVNTVTGTEVGVVNVTQVEPLAQTFSLSELTYISAIGLFFQAKHATLGYRVELRNVVNGYPGPEVYASKYLPASSITVSADSSVETTFTFDNVLGFKPNTEFCFVGIPEQANIGYELWCSELGTIDMLTGQRITTHPHDGVLFHSPNNKAWDPWTKRDLKFKLYKSNFEGDMQIVFDNLTGVEASRLVVAFDEFVAPGTNVKWSYSVDGGSTWDAFNPYIERNLENIIEQIQLRIDVTSTGGSYEIIDKFVGIILLYHDASAKYIGTNELFTDPLLYPNQINASMYVDADNVNSGIGTLVKCYASVDDGVSWFLVPTKEGYTPVAAENPYYVYQFQSPDEASVTGATNASPIVVTSAAHGFTNGMVVTIDSVEGNTNSNGDWVVTDATTDTFKLYTTAGVASSGNSAYTTGGTIVLKEFSQMRGRVELSTSNRARTPRVKKISYLANRVE
jgi:hypothetical protein